MSNNSGASSGAAGAGGAAPFSYDDLAFHGADASGAAAPQGVCLLCLRLHPLRRTAPAGSSGGGASAATAAGPTLCPSCALPLHAVTPAQAAAYQQVSSAAWQAQVARMDTPGGSGSAADDSNESENEDDDDDDDEGRASRRRGAAGAAAAQSLLGDSVLLNAVLSAATGAAGTSAQGGASAGSAGNGAGGGAVAMLSALSRLLSQPGTGAAASSNGRITRSGTSSAEANDDDGGMSPDLLATLEAAMAQMAAAAGDGGGGGGGAAGGGVGAGLSGLLDGLGLGLGLGLGGAAGGASGVESQAASKAAVAGLQRIAIKDPVLDLPVAGLVLRVLPAKMVVLPERPVPTPAAATVEAVAAETVAAGEGGAAAAAAEAAAASTVAAPGAPSGPPVVHAACRQWQQLGPPLMIKPVPAEFGPRPQTLWHRRDQSPVLAAAGAAGAAAVAASGGSQPLAFPRGVTGSGFFLLACSPAPALDGSAPPAVPSLPAFSCGGEGAASSAGAALAPAAFLFDRGGASFARKGLTAQMALAAAAGVPAGGSAIASAVSVPVFVAQSPGGTWPFVATDSKGEAAAGGLALPLLTLRPEDAAQLRKLESAMHAAASSSGAGGMEASASVAAAAGGPAALPRALLGRLEWESHEAEAGGDADSAAGGRSCAICCDAFASGDTAVLYEPCRHPFHEACLAPWLAARHTCPVCRAALPRETPESPYEAAMRAAREAREAAAAEEARMAALSASWYG